MRKLLIGLAIFFTLFAIALSVLPFDTLAFLPIGLAIVFGLLLMQKSNENQKKFPKILLTIAALCSAFVLGKTILSFSKNSLALISSSTIIVLIIVTILFIFIDYVPKQLVNGMIRMVSVIKSLRISPIQTKQNHISQGHWGQILVNYE